MMVDLVKLRDHFLSWIAMGAALYSALQWMVMPMIQEAIRAESHKNHYIRYDDWCDVYAGIEENGALSARQAIQKEKFCKKRDTYRELILIDYQTGIVAEISELEVQ